MQKLPSMNHYSSLTMVSSRKDSRKIVPETIRLIVWNPAGTIAQKGIRCLFIGSKTWGKGEKVVGRGQVWWEKRTKNITLANNKHDWCISRGTVAWSRGLIESKSSRIGVGRSTRSRCAYNGVIHRERDRTDGWTDRRATYQYRTS